MTDHTMNPAPTSLRRWQTFHCALNWASVSQLARQIASQHGATLLQMCADQLSLVNDRGCVVADLYSRLSTTRREATLGHCQEPHERCELHLVASAKNPEPVVTALADSIRAAVLPFTECELAQIVRSMPMVCRFSDSEEMFSDWALIFRDHYLEHSVGFLEGMHRAGIPAQWIFALAKGDRTRNRDRIHATFLASGFRSGLLDNALFASPDPKSVSLAVRGELDAFINAAHADGRRVLVIDDGGLIALGYGTSHAPVRVDAAIELTVSGLKRIREAGTLDIPVVNMARSTIKTLLGYPEIADSCVRRIRELLPTNKFIGRPVLLIGYGILGSRLAPLLRALGVRVSVVDGELLPLISAAEAGFTTFRSVREALNADSPFLIVSAAGEPVLDVAALRYLPDGVFLAPFATRDFSVCAEPEIARFSADIPGVGRRFMLPNGRTFVMLGEGRSLNLFEADSIPNEGYDAYRAGTLLAAKQLVRQIDTLGSGVLDRFADEVVAATGLFEYYYDTHLSIRRGQLTGNFDRDSQG